MQFRSIQEELVVTKFRKDIEREIGDYFENIGFSIMEPKVFQPYNDFIISNPRKDTSETVKVLSGDSSIYILRSDITTNILNQIFHKWDRESPLRVYYNSKIYRNGPRGEILQNYQMGVESLGDNIFDADSEIIEMASYLMSTLGEAYILELGSSNYLNGFFKEINLNPSEELEIRDLISKKNRDGLRKKLKSLKIKNTILDEILDMQGKLDEVIKITKSYDMNKEMEEALNSLLKLNEVFMEKNILDEIKYDLSMIPDVGYYDGIMFRGYCLSVPTKILSGGRYDKSTEKYGRKVPAIGFMIDMDLVTRIRTREGK